LKDLEGVQFHTYLWGLSDKSSLSH
jgi:hypothetical protein